YRFDEHQVGLFIKSPYRTKDELEHFKAQRDPISLYRQGVLMSQGFTESELAAIEAEVADAVGQAIRFGEESPSPTPSTLSDYLYSHTARDSEARIADVH